MKQHFNSVLYTVLGCVCVCVSVAAYGPENWEGCVNFDFLYISSKKVEEHL